MRGGGGGHNPSNDPHSPQNGQSVEEARAIFHCPASVTHEKKFALLTTLLNPHGAECHGDFKYGTEIVHLLSPKDHHSSQDGRVVLPR